MTLLHSHGGEGEAILSSLEVLGNAHVHVAEVLGDVGCGGPLASLGKWVADVFARVPELDKRVFCGWIGGDVDE